MKSWNLTLSLPSTSTPPIVLLEHHLHNLHHIDAYSTGLSCVCVYVYVSACVDLCHVRLCAYEDQEIAGGSVDQLGTSIVSLILVLVALCSHTELQSK